ncbi:hypothetical protein TRFO_31235 [Tritrichomonas foetus]|uniref:Uncharacterized protein n=1 Tax=Tritrichomonas foetus TaxID=1144522 RepID=A0A1J4JWI3_9EUKA|nr:hypothetical protein TRFO_31235 [Tritrichomonas foetus]|eukprot:OHT01886.1 hypothetical protein TRFO_31235 [Tritrichomonas foetus]
MFFLFLIYYAIISEKVPFSMPKSMIPTSFAQHFVSTGQIRLIGFTRQIKDLKKKLTVLVNSKFMKIDVINDNPDIHHTFRANVDSLNISFSNDNQLEEAISKHFADNPVHFAVYVVRSETPLPNLNTNIIASGKNWLAIRFYDQNTNLENQINSDSTAYQIAIQVLDIFSDIFNHQLYFEPRVSILNSHDSISIYQSGEFDSASIVKESVLGVAQLNISISKIDPKIFKVLCSICSDTNCALSWIKRLPEYSQAQETRSLPVFLMPPVCSFQYASNDVAFAPIMMENSLKSIIRKSLFGFETKPQSEPFFNIIAQRNMAVYPTQRLVELLKKPVEEISELSQFNSVVIPQKVVETLDERYTNFTKVLQHLTLDVIEKGNDVAKEHWEQLNDTAQMILEAWSVVSDDVKRKRMCVGNLLDLTKSRLFITRPTFYLILSIFASLMLFHYSFKHMNPKVVVNTLLTEPSTIL